jgi:Holliday junction resolvase-like predicted endonuclease
MAAAVLDFWTSDWVAMGHRLRNGGSGLEPELFERPVIKMGQQLLQLPWLVGAQNNTSAAINNLRRLGARRSEQKAETWQIEQRLGERFKSRGFRVLMNWVPPKNGGVDPGEIDLICALDGIVLVIELKSTYLRRSLRDAWLHKTTTLRQAGQQLRDKVACVERELSGSDALRENLGLLRLPAPFAIHGWIVDTSIEEDHMRFGGFLKVSLEEVLLALRDDAYLLCKPGEAIGGGVGGPPAPAPSVADALPTLYPSGFNAERYVAVIEGAVIWG